MTRRGLTLLEVVAATVLLTIIAAACLPLLAEARRWADSTKSANQIGALMRTADEVIADPIAFGIEAEAMHTKGFSQVIDPVQEDDPALGPISIELLASNNAPRDTDSGDHPKYGWLVFKLDSATIIRYIDLPDPPEETREDTEA